jgi:SAM-dependent methyltransferase
MANDQVLGSSTGFGDVDRHPDTAGLIAAMKAADAYPAVSSLRAWLADELRLRLGNSVIDVGCGPGASTFALCDRVGPDGRVVGIDSSAAMIDAAQDATPSNLHIRFATGDASALETPDGSFDAYRSERTYQWLADPTLALAEALRVVRPGGRIGVIDTDWGTLALDHPDGPLSERLAGRVRGYQPGPLIGRQLLRLFRTAGIEDLNVRVETIVATEWEPSSTPGVAGVVPFATAARQATDAGVLTAREASDWLTGLEQAAADGYFFLCVNMIGVVGSRPR